MRYEERFEKNTWILARTSDHKGVAAPRMCMRGITSSHTESYR